MKERVAEYWICEARGYAKAALEDLFLELNAQNIPDPELREVVSSMHIPGGSYACLVVGFLFPNLPENDISELATCLTWREDAKYRSKEIQAEVVKNIDAKVKTLDIEKKLTAMQLDILTALFYRFDW